MKTITTPDAATVDSIGNSMLRTLQRVAECTEPVVVSASAAGATITMSHTLGGIPMGIKVDPWVDARWWAGPNERALWSADRVVFSVSAAGRYSVSVWRI